MISALAIVTRSRTEGLKRALTSYVANAKHFGRRPRLAVCDDTPDADARAACRAELGRLSKADDLPYIYAGLEEKQAFAAALERASGVERAIIEFALFDPLGCGLTTGANRNALLLETAGECFFSADDDTVCRMAGATDPDPNLRFSSASNPTDIWAFADAAAAHNAVRFLEVDLLGLHERYLGKTAEQCMDAHADTEVDIKGVSPELAKKIVSTKGRVRMTWMGILGDCGFRYPSYLLNLKKPARRMLMVSEAHYRAACRSRQILRVPPSAVVGGEGGFFQSTALALDHQDLLPPFLPVCRGQDGVFGQLFTACWTDDFLAYLPFAIDHDPQPPREAKAEDVQHVATKLQMHHIVLSCIRQFALPAGAEPAQRLELLGKHFMDLAQEGPDHFENYVLTHIRKTNAKIAESLTDALHAHHGTPGYWAADVKGALKRLRDGEADPDYLAPEDLRDGRTPEEARRLAQRLLGEFGRLLIAWPRLVATAQSLKSQGIQLGQKVKNG